MFVIVTQVCTLIIATRTKVRETLHDSRESERNQVFERALYYIHTPYSVEEFRAMRRACVRDQAGGCQSTENCEKDLTSHFLSEVFPLSVNPQNDLCLIQTNVGGILK